MNQLSVGTVKRCHLISMTTYLQSDAHGISHEEMNSRGPSLYRQSTGSTEEELGPLDVMGLCAELCTIAAPGFLQISHYFSKSQVPAKQPFNFFFMKSFQTFQLSWSHLGILPDESSCCFLIVMKNLFQTEKPLQVLLRADPKSNPFRDTFQEKASFFFPSSNSVQRLFGSVYCKKKAWETVSPGSVFLWGLMEE